MNMIKRTKQIKIQYNIIMMEIWEINDTHCQIPKLVLIKNSKSGRSNKHTRDGMQVILCQRFSQNIAEI